MRAVMDPRRDADRRTPTRTCVGCGLPDAAARMVRVVMAGATGKPARFAESEPNDAGIVFDLAGGSFGRGAHVHARSACLLKAPRGIARSFRRSVSTGADEMGRRLVAACDQRMVGLVLAARRIGALEIGADASFEAIRRGAPLAIVAVDAGTVASSLEVTRAAADGRAIAWSNKSDLGGLLGERAVAICAVRHDAIALELKRMRAAADAGVAVTREGAECSRSPEAR
jgi:predicted RNA-binding protein YlxR (DUF448 family)